MQSRNGKEGVFELHAFQRGRRGLVHGCTISVLLHHPLHVLTVAFHDRHVQVLCQFHCQQLAALVRTV